MSKFVLCVNPFGTFVLTEGKVYEVMGETLRFYIIMCDDNFRSLFVKERFILVSEEKETELYV